MEKSSAFARKFLFVLLWVIATILFASLVRTSSRDPENSGPLGSFALQVASLPDTYAQLFSQLGGQLSGDYVDAELYVEQAEPIDLTGFEPITTSSGIGLDGVYLRASTPATRGWYIVAGAFVLNGRIGNAALLISPDYEVVHAWHLTEAEVNGVDIQPDYLKFIHGLEVMHDGSLLIAFDNGRTIQRIDHCSQPIWVQPLVGSHAITLQEDEKTAWAPISDSHFTEFNTATGKTVRSFSLQDLIEANTEIDILGLRQSHDNMINDNARNTEGRWLYDPFHTNDIDPLPASLSGAFDGFDAGDVLISLRSLNLLMIVDPDTRKIKWWRVGATRRQHDPDWMPTGEIMVFNNRMGQDYSEIIAIDPQTMARRSIIDGRNVDFYSRIRGKQQALPDGGILVTSSQQGRIFQTNGQGNINFELLNVKPGTDRTAYSLSQAIWMESIGFDPEALKCPSKN